MLFQDLIEEVKTKPNCKKMWVWEIKQKPGSEVNPCSFKLRTTRQQNVLTSHETPYDREFTRKTAGFPTGKCISSTLRLKGTFISVASSSQSLTAEFSVNIHVEEEYFICHFTLAQTFNTRWRVSVSRCSFDFPTRDPTRRQKRQSWCDYLEPITSLWSVCWKTILIFLWKKWRKSGSAHRRRDLSVRYLAVENVFCRNVKVISELQVKASYDTSPCWSARKTPSSLFPSRLSGLWMTAVSLPLLKAEHCSIAQGSRESCTAWEQSWSSVHCVTAPSFAQCLVHYRKLFYI